MQGTINNYETGETNVFLSAFQMEGGGEEQLYWELVPEHWCHNKEGPPSSG